MTSYPYNAETEIAKALAIAVADLLELPRLRDDQRIDDAERDRRIVEIGSQIAQAFEHAKG